MFDVFDISAVQSDTNRSNGKSISQWPMNQVHHCFLKSKRDRKSCADVVSLEVFRLSID